MTIYFGKYYGKSFKWVMKNDQNYCSFILNQRDCNGNFLEFQNYLKKKNFMNTTSIHFTSKSVCDISNILSSDEEYLHSIDSFNERLYFTDKIIKDISIPEDLFGIFIDYLIRYEMAEMNKIKFIDTRIDKVFKNYEIKNISDIFIGCQAHFLSSNDNYEITKEFNQEIANYNHEIIKNYTNSFKINDKYDLFLNPTLDNDELKIYGDADLIVNNNLIDFKMSNYSGTTNKDFIQLLIYSVLYYLKYSTVLDSVEIYNPLLGFKRKMFVNETIIKNTIIKLKEIQKVKNEIKFESKNNFNKNIYLEDELNYPRFLLRSQTQNDIFENNLNLFLIAHEKEFSINENYDYHLYWNDFTQSFNLEILNEIFTIKIDNDLNLNFYYDYNLHLHLNVSEELFIDKIPDDNVIYEVDHLIEWKVVQIKCNNCKIFNDKYTCDECQMKLKMEELKTNNPNNKYKIIKNIIHVKRLCCKKYDFYLNNKCSKCNNG